jgi:hypothetical protein
LETIAIAFVFLIMLAAPCAIALRSAKMGRDSDASDAPEANTQSDQILDQPFTLAELAIRAESDAIAAQQFADDAQRSALAAAAHAARLRADAAIEAAKLAERINRAARTEYLPGDHPSLDFPRSRQRRRAA